MWTDFVSKILPSLAININEEEDSARLVMINEVTSRELGLMMISNNYMVCVQVGRLELELALAPA